MHETIKEKLLEYQINHVENLIRIVKTNNIVFDASETGVGKSYAAMAVCKELNLNPIIICPKSIISMWTKVATIFKVNVQSIGNYELYKIHKHIVNGKKVQCEYIIDNENYKNKEVLFNDRFSQYEWKVPNNSIFIFDEVHRANNDMSMNGRLLFSAKLTNVPILMLSATVADTPIKFKFFFWLLNFIEPNVVKKVNMQYPEYLHKVNKWIIRTNNPMLTIHNMLFPTRASRIRIDALGDAFPETQIIAEAYHMGVDREKAIEKEYTIIGNELEKLGDKSENDTTNILTKIMRAQQKIELLKVPTFVELAHDYIEAGGSVVIFVSFTQTLETLAEMLHTNVLVYGDQTQEEREKNIEAFQSDKERIIICNIKAGGVGISLHDINGKYRRYAILSPTWDATSMIQALGRVRRAGSKSKSIQRIIFCANTIEEKIADKLKTKLRDVNLLNNGGVKDVLSDIFLKKN
jgi:superfamily II DNA or RNA helicase